MFRRLYEEKGAKKDSIQELMKIIIAQVNKIHLEFITKTKIKIHKILHLPTVQYGHGHY